MQKNELTDLAHDKFTFDEKIGVVSCNDIANLMDSWQGLKDEI